MTASYLPIAVRAYTERMKRRRELGRFHRPVRRVPSHILVIDAETTIDVTQALLFLTHRFCRVTEKDGQIASACLEEGLVHADDLSKRDPHGYRRLRRYAARHRLPIMPRETFLKKVLWPAYKGQFAIVGFNLPFDLSRLASASGETRIRNKYDNRFANGFSFIVWSYRDATGRLRGSPFRPRVAIKAIDRSRAFKAFQRPERLDDINKIRGGRTHGPQTPQD